MKIKRIVSIVLALTFIFSAMMSLASCTKKEEAPVTSRRTNVFGGHKLDTTNIPGWINQVFTTDSAAYLTTNKDYTIIYDDKGNEYERRSGYYYEQWYGDEGIDDGEVIIYDTEIIPEATAESEKPQAETTPSTPSTKPHVDVPTQGDDEYSVILPDGWYMGYLSVQSVNVVPFDGSALKEYEIDLGKEYQDFYMNNMSIGNDGNAYLVMRGGSWDEETQMYAEQLKLLIYDFTGNRVVSEVRLDEKIKEAIGASDDQYFYYDPYIDSNGYLYLTIDTKLIVLDPDFNVVTKEEKDGWFGYVAIKGDKAFITSNSGNGGGDTLEIYEKGKKLDINTDFYSSETYREICGAIGNIIYLRDTAGITSVDVSTGEEKEFVNFLNCDIDTYETNNVTVLNDGRFFATNYVYDGSGNGMSCYIYERIPDEEMKDEVIVTLGMATTDSTVTKSIIRYNRKNTGIRVNVVTYDKYNTAENEWNGAWKQFNTDLSTGKVPDLVLLNENLSAESLFRNNVFADLSKFIDDPEKGIDRSKYLENVIEACTENGKTYSMILSFRLMTLVAKSKFVGNKPGWTFEQMMNCINSLPEGTEPFFGQSRNEIMEYFFVNSLSSFVDWDTAETKFETKGFIDFINYLATLPEKGFWESYYGEMGDDYVYDPEKENELQETYNLRFFKDRALFNYSFINNFTFILENRQTFASPDITAIGCPTDNEKSSGAIIYPVIEFAIGQTSKVKNQAWEVMKYFMDDKELYGSSGGGIIRDDVMLKSVAPIYYYSFATNLEILNESYKSAPDNWYYYPADDSEYQWLKDMGYSDEYIEYTKNSRVPYSQDAADQVMDIVKNATDVMRSDTGLVDIIKEELSSFFAGTKSAEETARIIAGRARTYISEHS